MKIDGNDIRIIYGVELKAEVSYPILTDVRLNLKELSNYGSINLGSMHGVRQITIPCVIIGEDSFNKLQQFSRLFLDFQGNFKEVMVEFPRIPNKRIKCILSENISADRVHQNYVDFEMKLIAPYPFYESIYQSNIYRESINNSDNLSVEYFGTKSTGFLMSLFGKVGGFTIVVTSPNGNKSFQYERESGDTYLVIDFENFTINDNGADGLRNSSGSFLELDQSTTSIRIEGDIKASCSVIYREKYVV